MRRNDALIVTAAMEWRAWLAQHAADRAEVWLAFCRTGTRAVGYDAAVEEALCFGWYDALQQSIDDDYYAIQFVPRPRGKKWTQDDLATAFRLLRAGRMVAAGKAAMP
jgi:uncharacterized protein YdeI (YjbR/CyaY-like superfamily)